MKETWNFARFRGAVFFGLVLAALATTDSALATELEFQDIKLSNNAEFRFRPGASEVVDRLPMSPNSDGVEMGSTSHFELLIDERDIGAKNGCDYFSYVFYARKKGAGVTGPFYRFPMKGYSVGVIQDDRIDATFSLASENGKILIPIFGCSSSLLSGPSWTETEPIGVNLLDGVRIPLKLRNSLTNVSVQLRAPVQSPSTLNREYWRSLHVLAPNVQDSLLIPPNSDTGNTYVLEAIPRPGAAFMIALFSFAPKTADDHLSVTFTYSTRGGMSRPLSLDVPVRFVPWPPLLFLAVAAGSALGAMAHFLMKRRKTWRPALRESAVVLVISEVAEILAMVLAAHKSGLRILGFDLDPFQLLPASLLGILIGLMGVEGCKSLVAAFLKIGKPSEAGKNAT